MPSIAHLCLAVGLATACRTPAPTATVQDTSIVGTAPETQRSTAFCWAFALVAHLEQRYYEQTRGVDQGGFRLNFSEEYLGLLHLTHQLVTGQPLSEGMRLSESLALVERYGIVPEKVGDRVLFKPEFNYSIATALAKELTASGHEEGAVMTTESALTLIEAAIKVATAPAGVEAPAAREARFNQIAQQRRFLAAVLGAGPSSDAEFRYANGTYTPQSWAKQRLKFDAVDYYVLRFPDTKRGQFGEDPYAPEYVRAMAIVKKALLYGYSVPISFNFVRHSKETAGVLGCSEDKCWDAELAAPTTSWPHTNHAVVLVDYRSAASTFEPVSAATIDDSFATMPVEWVFKNSWGFNHNTSTQAELLKRYPLPAYTVMTQEFFEASHRLKPDRYEAIVPRDVCLRDLTPARAWTCKPLITASGEGLPTADEVDLTLDTALIVGNVNKAATSRYAVTYVKDAPILPSTNHSMTLVEPFPRPQQNGMQQANLVAQTEVSGMTGKQFDLCMRVQPSAQVRYVAVYYAKTDQEAEAAPQAVLSEPASWQYCKPVQNAAQSFQVVLQPLDARLQVLGQMRTTVHVTR